MLTIPPIPTPCPLPVPALIVKDGEVFANSRDVAKAFGKPHKDVLRAIRSKVESLLSLSMAQFCAKAFRPVSYRFKTGFGFREGEAFELNRDGFSIIALGFTGEKAVRFQVAYIQEFNRMEAALRQPPEADPTPAVAPLSDFEKRFQEAVPLLMQALAVMAGGGIALAMFSTR